MRQAKTQGFFSKIYTKVYNYEFLENYPLIQILLPPPSFLTISNTQQMIDNATQLADKIIDVELSNEEDDVKAELKKLYTRSY